MERTIREEPVDQIPTDDVTAQQRFNNAMNAFGQAVVGRMQQQGGLDIGDLIVRTHSQALFIQCLLALLEAANVVHKNQFFGMVSDLAERATVQIKDAPVIAKA